ncbi:MAG TPA: hypothetical protein VGF67_25215 [Ktedonobacteraceae bacterium]
MIVRAGITGAPDQANPVFARHGTPTGSICYQQSQRRKSFSLCWRPMTSTTRVVLLLTAEHDLRPGLPTAGLLSVSTSSVCGG